jgi:hypothetical protein
MKDPFIFRVLDISTGHMTSEDNEILTAETRDGEGTAPVYELAEYGWLVYVGEIDNNWPLMSPEFRNILTKATALGCDYVRFDRDGREYPELPSFDW